jgi:hypothetical protein
MQALGTALAVAGAVYLVAVIGWVGGFLPFGRREAAARGESYDRRRASALRGSQLVLAIIAVLVGVWLARR